MFHPRGILVASLSHFGFVALAAIATSVVWGQTPPSSSKREGATPGMIVVAPERFHGELKSFVEYKRREMAVEVVALETVLRQASGVDDPEKLKRYLYREWREKHVRYVLLVGDASVLPVRYMVLDRVTPVAYDFAFYPSDLYYADVAKPDGSFEDWNAQKDDFHGGYFGEVRGEKNKSDPINFDQIDYRPELAVGRWPVNTPEQVRTVAAKTIAFEERLAAAKEPPRVGLISVGGWVDSRGVLDRVAASMPESWKIEKQYYSDGKKKPSTPPPSEKEVLGLLNAGIDLVVHTGHGSDTSWEGCFFLKHLDQVKNAERLPVMISAGCSTARFATLPPYEAYVDVHGAEHKGTDAGEVFKAPPPPPAPYQNGRFNPPGLGKQLLVAGPNGAVAYIGCNTGSQPCGLTLAEGFAKAWSHGKDSRLGDCWAEAVANYYDKEHLATLKPNADWYPPSIFFQGMKFMLYGDPSLRLPR